MGTIIKRGKSYQVQISIYKHGIQKRLTKTFKTKMEAKYWEREMEIMKGNGTHMSHWSKPFAEFYSDWVCFVKKDDVRESTFQNYERSIKIIGKLFSNIQLRHLNDIIVQRKIDEYSKTQSKRTTNDLLTKIKTSLRYAHARGYIQRDFTGILKARGYEVSNRNKVLSITNRNRLLNYLKSNINNETNSFLYLILQTGLRRGECMAIRLMHVCKSFIMIEESISPTSEDRDLKSKSSYRKVPITEEIYYLLKSIPIKPNGYIFDTNNFTHVSKLKEKLKELNIPATTLHGLRKSYASFLYSLSNDEGVISELLGHKNTYVTKEYYIEPLEETSSEIHKKVRKHL